jgi:putative tricarboxylic transport membrane protein
MVEEAVKAGMSGDRLKLHAQGSALRQWRYFMPVWLRSSVIGIVIGILPGAGGSMSSFLAYNEAKRVARDPASFGHGNPEGVAASECGNGADNAASLIPALALGIPGSGVAAVILGGLLVHDLRPGPQIFREHPDIVYGFMLQFLVTSLMLAVLGGLAATRIDARQHQRRGHQRGRGRVEEHTDDEHQRVCRERQDRAGEGLEQLLDRQYPAEQRRRAASSGRPGP